MTIVLDVSFDDNQQQRGSDSSNGNNNSNSQNSAIKDVSNKKMKDKQRDKACSSKAALKVAKVKTKVS